jgi:catechol 2,3-dioxygenase-like lactoylglutathione lyase family enzyme
LLTRFDHVVIGVRFLDRAITLWRDRLGFDAQLGGRHTGRGTENGIVRFGLDYVELISIYDRGEVEGRMENNALALAQLLDRSEGGVLGFALATDDATADLARFRAAGFDVIGPAAMQRRRPDGHILHWRLLVPEGGSWGTPLPFFIQWDTADDERLSWEQPGSHANGATGVAALAITVRDLDAAIDVYERQLGLRLVARDSIAGLGAHRARFAIGQTMLDLLAPAGAGVIGDTVDQGIERPWQVTLSVSDLAASRQVLASHGVRLLPAPGNPAGLLIDPDDAIGARIVLLASA